MLIEQSNDDREVARIIAAINEIADKIDDLLRDYRRSQFRTRAKHVANLKTEARVDLRKKTFSLSRELRTLGEFMLRHELFYDDNRGGKSE